MSYQILDKSKLFDPLLTSYTDLEDFNESGVFKIPSTMTGCPLTPYRGILINYKYNALGMLQFLLPSTSLNYARVAGAKPLMRIKDFENNTKQPWREIQLNNLST